MIYAAMASADGRRRGCGAADKRCQWYVVVSRLTAQGYLSCTSPVDFAAACCPRLPLFLSLSLSLSRSLSLSLFLSLSLSLSLWISLTIPQLHGALLRGVLRLSVGRCRCHYKVNDVKCGTWIGNMRASQLVGW